MAVRSCLPHIEVAFNSLMTNERRGFSGADACALPPLPPPPRWAIWGSSSGAAAGFRGASDSGETQLRGDALWPNDAVLRGDDFGGVCVRQFRLGDVDGARTVVLSMTPQRELPAPSPAQRPAPSEAGTHSSRPEPQEFGSAGFDFPCKHCPRVCVGSQRRCGSCVWGNGGEQPGKAGVGTATAQGRGRAESYQSAAAARHAAIDAKPSTMVDCEDRSSRHEDLSAGVCPSDRRACQVCGDDASGCHYGAVTCDSCKVFFKRATAGKKNHLCASRNDCTIDKLRRKNCASCRLKRCFMFGMSLKGPRLKGAGQSNRDREEFYPSPMVLGGIMGRPEKRDVIVEHGSAVGGAQASQAFAGGVPAGAESCLSLPSLLRAIEPALTSSGHDPTKPDSFVSLLSSLNRLGECELLALVRWAKAIPGFRDLHIDDQMTMIQFSWIGVMVFTLGWRSHTIMNSSVLYFAPDLVFNDQRMHVSTMYEHCVRMKLLSQRLCMLKVTQEEFVCMKVVTLLSMMPVEGLKSQRCFDDLRTFYINELARLAGESTPTSRLFQLTQLLDYLQSIAGMLHQFTHDIYIENQVLQTGITYPELIMETASIHVHKLLSGMVKPILFHDAL